MIDEWNSGAAGKGVQFIIHQFAIINQDWVRGGAGMVRDTRTRGGGKGFHGMKHPRTSVQTQR
jgi:hypothetical protein